MPAPAQPAPQTTAPAVQEVAPPACTAAATAAATASPPAAGDGGHVTPEAAAAADGKPFKANKKCPCPNCRPLPPAAPAAAGGTGAKGASSYAANVKRGGEGDMVWQLGKNAAQQARKQQQQQQQQGGGKAAAGQQGGGKAAGGKGGKGKSGGKQFDVKALPAKPLMAVPTGKQMAEAKPQPKKPKESFKVKLQKLTAKLVKRKKE